jgi:hypothetical protein
MASCENGNKNYFLACVNHGVVLSVNFALIRDNGMVCESLIHCSFMENCGGFGRVFLFMGCGVCLDCWRVVRFRH